MKRALPLLQVLFVIGSLTHGVSAQDSSNQIARLPDSPGFISSQTMEQTQATVERAIVEGAVFDTQGAVVPGASVILSRSGAGNNQSAMTDGNGTFEFLGVAPGQYTLTISRAGMGAFTSTEFSVAAGERVQAPQAILQITSSATVNVTATREQVAEAQINAQIKQRVLGIVPNFYTSYIWNAEPMSAKQKYKLAVRSSIDPVNFLIVAGVAGAQQYNNTYPDYGAGISGYGKRYAAAYTDSFTGKFIGSAVLPSIFHQDPRYFYQGSWGFRSRSEHAISSTFICRGDNGKLQPNYSHLLGSLAAGAITNAYHPSADRGVGLTF